MLTLVPTPVGNLKDITLRALEVLKASDVILAEDTRKTRILLNHYEIKQPCESYHAHNEHAKTASLVKRMEEGQKMGDIAPKDGSPYRAFFETYIRAHSVGERIKK